MDKLLAYYIAVVVVLLGLKSSFGAGLNTISLKARSWSHTLDVSFNTNARRVEDNEKSYQTQFYYYLRNQVDKNHLLTFTFDFNKDFSKSYEDKLGDTKMTLSRNAINVSDSVSYLPSASLVLPTSRKSANNDTLVTSLEINNGFNYNVNNHVSFYYLPRLIKNFHRFKISESNRMNVEYKTLQVYSANYAFNDSLYLSSNVILVHSWTYSGRRRDTAYLTNIEMNYAISKDLRAGLGTLQGGSVVDLQNGPNETVQLYDRNATTLYGKFTLKL